MCGDGKLRLAARTIRPLLLGRRRRKWRRRGRWVSRAPVRAKGIKRGITRPREETRGENRMSDSCATTPPPASSGDYANVIINCQCSLFNDSSSRLLNTPNHRYVTKIAIQVHRCVSKLLIPRRSCITVAAIRSSFLFFFSFLFLSFRFSFFSRTLYTSSMARCSLDFSIFSR